MSAYLWPDRRRMCSKRPPCNISNFYLEMMLYFAGSAGLAVSILNIFQETQAASGILLVFRDSIRQKCRFLYVRPRPKPNVMNVNIHLLGRNKLDSQSHPHPGGNSSFDLHTTSCVIFLCQNIRYIPYYRDGLCLAQKKEAAPVFSKATSKNVLYASAAL